jgi:hypothetical protein
VFAEVQAVKLGQTIDFSPAQVGAYKGQVTAYYNGKVSTGNLAKIPLPSEAQVQLDVGKPIVAPDHVTFPKGLAASMSKSK